MLLANMKKVIIQKYSVSRVTTWDRSLNLCRLGAHLSAWEVVLAYLLPAAFLGCPQELQDWLSWNATGRTGRFVGLPLWNLFGSFLFDGFGSRKRTALLTRRSARGSRLWRTTFAGLRSGPRSTLILIQRPTAAWRS